MGIFDGFQAHCMSGETTPNWTHEVGDWIVSPSWGGLIDHHMRVIDRLTDINGQRWYRIFDTTLARGHADYEWVAADALERNSRIVQRPHPFFVLAILDRAAKCKGLKYSVSDRQDCESLQRWIHTGQEQYRWCPQVWTAVATVFGSVLIAAFQKKASTRRRTGRRR